MASASSDSTIQRSRPIAIEIPANRNPQNDPTSAPPAPLSARGDLPGGYFPNHEDPEIRVRRTHPFYADVREARRKSIAQAAQSASPHNNCNHSPNGTSDQSNLNDSNDSNLLNIPDIQVPGSAAGMPFRPTATAPAGPLLGEGPVDNSFLDSMSPTSVMSYNPTGAQDNLLPMGKYYPTNWENRKRQKRLLREQQEKQKQQQQEQVKRQEPSHQGPAYRSSSPDASKTSSTATPSSPKLKAENPSVAKNKAPHLSHSRSDSEAKRRLQQYQRDMITQATLAASQVIRDRGSASGASPGSGGSDEIMAALSRVPAMRNLQLPCHLGVGGGSNGRQSSGSSSVMSPLGGGQGTVIPTMIFPGLMPNPVSPRLQPLGSPGPVTPIDLTSSPGPGPVRWDETRQLGGQFSVSRGAPSGRPPPPLAAVSAPPAAPGGGDGGAPRRSRLDIAREAGSFPFHAKDS